MEEGNRREMRKNGYMERREGRERGERRKKGGGRK